ncbi:MAG: hypothetical protein RMA76_11395 [Deltaproteobacteria bacterium]|jgi:hypothetical protein
MIQRLLDHFGRLGGVIIAPRSTLTGVLRAGRGGLFEVLPWMLIVAAMAQPTRAGQALLIGRLSLFDGFNAVARMFADRMIAPLIGVLVAASVLYLFDRLRGVDEAQRVTFEGAVDACAFMLVPFLLLAAIGVAMRAYGVGQWWTPNNSMTGRDWVLATRIAVAFVWPSALFAVVFWDLRRTPER